MFPRKVGSAWEVYPPAKLNLFLEILNRQGNGYHELETLMVPIRLADTLQWSPGSLLSGCLDSGSSGSPRMSSTSPSDRDSVTKLGLHVMSDFRWHSASMPCPNASDSRPNASDSRPNASGPADSWIPVDNSNLVLRAAQLLAHRAGVQPFGIFTLYKRIPTRAGLGGGSSDAAATLILANAAWKINYSQARLLELAAELGSDVPFFVATSHTRGAAICRGRGERVETIGSLGHLHFVLVKPTVGLSTKEIFKQVDLDTIRRQPVSSSPLHTVIAALRRGALVEACRSISNRLEAIAMANCDLLRHLREIFKQCLCCGHWMTGSGSAYVGLVRSAKQARYVTGMLRARQMGTVFTTTSY